VWRSLKPFDRRRCASAGKVGVARLTAPGRAAMYSCDKWYKGYEWYEWYDFAADAAISALKKDFPCFLQAIVYHRAWTLDPESPEAAV